MRTKEKIVVKAGSARMSVAIAVSGRVGLVDFPDECAQVILEIIAAFTGDGIVNFIEMTPSGPREVELAVESEAMRTSN